MGGGTTGLVMLGSVRSQAEQAMRSKPGGALLCGPSLHQHLPSASCPVLVSVLTSFNDDVDVEEQNKLFPLQVTLVILFHNSKSNPN